MDAIRILKWPGGRHHLVAHRWRLRSSGVAISSEAGRRSGDLLQRRAYSSLSGYTCRDRPAPPTGGLSSRSLFFLIPHPEFSASCFNFALGFSSKWAFCQLKALRMLLSVFSFRIAPLKKASLMFACSNLAPLRSALSR